MSTNSRITKTLYRQLLRWCKTVPSQKIPLTTFVPPVHLTSSDGGVDAFGLEVLATLPPSSDGDYDTSVARVRHLLPIQTELTRTTLTVPIHTVNDIRNVIRAVFRLNQAEPSSHPEYLKTRLSATFTALKSLNELSATLEAVENQRQEHQSRPASNDEVDDGDPDLSAVQFRVGQVVQHQQKRWRGVVARWSRPTGSSLPAQGTSLTSKDYSPAARGTVTYDIILDAGDSVRTGTVSAWAQAEQADLQQVDDAALVRVQSIRLDQYFTRFDAAQKQFVPTPLVAYQFPDDFDSDTSSTNTHNNTLSVSHAKQCVEMIAACQALASRLRRCILDETSCPKDRKLTLLTNILQRLDDIAAGDVFSRQERYMQPPKQEWSPVTRVTRHLQALMHLQLEAVDLNNQRRISKENKSRIEFGLGDIVKHKKYGFRGVVVTWDPTPALDVRQWDGLQDIEDPMKRPFYHVIPDQGDCIRAFGGERPARYVCQDNLELCPLSERAELQVDMDQMEPAWMPTETGYSPPQIVKFRFGEDIEDDGITERCVMRIQDEFNSLDLLARQSDPSDALALQLSEQRLLDLLQIVDNAADANIIQDTIKEYRKANRRRDLRWQLDRGSNALVGGQGRNALDIYETILKEDPTYVEAWNKLATYQFMYGDYEESKESTQKVLEMDPNHTQAMAGMGLLHFENDEYQQSIDCFRQALALDPWSPVGSRLSLALDMLDKVIPGEEEIGDK